MQVRIPIMIQDRLATQHKGLEPTESYTTQDEDFFLDGPVSKRVAIIDFRPETGALESGARCIRPRPGEKCGSYVAPSRPERPLTFDAVLNDPRNAELLAAFIQVNTFGTVLKTMQMFEEADCLGRKVTWAFDQPQLLVVPRAGEWANAFYERDSASIQLFYISSPDDPGQRLYSSLSRDIVAHETAHAILDGIARELYHAITPQSLALHESIADLTALLMAIDSPTLRKTLLDQTGGDIGGQSAFTTIAEEFGHARNPEGAGLRSLRNQKIFMPGTIEPHDLSQVLSGALYEILVKSHTKFKQRIAAEKHQSEFSASGQALFVASRIFRRMIYRALDYLPPGDISFADYGRAIIAADQSAFPEERDERGWICEEFVRRGLVPNIEALHVPLPGPDPALAQVNLQALYESDWAAYEFANQHRAWLGIPEGAQFYVRPRLHTQKTGGYNTPKMRECIFKVSWNEEEPSQLSASYAPKRQITVGTTLVLDWETKDVRALLTSDCSRQNTQHANWQQHRGDRDTLLRQLADEGMLQADSEAVGPDGKELRSVIKTAVVGDVMRVRGAARLLHIV